MSLGNGELANGYFVTVTTSLEQIYVQVRRYKPGASVEQPPGLDKTARLENSEINRRLVKAYKGTLAEYIAQLPIPAGGYAVTHPQLTDFQKKLLEERLEYDR